MLAAAPSAWAQTDVQQPAAAGEPLAPAETYFITGDATPAGPGRPGRRFDPDTEVRLTGEQLRERGITNLAQALVDIPELLVRPSGRGEQRVDVRGARKGGVLLLVDGMPVNEPFYGTFDMSSIPVTDIVELRVSLSPASPLDGPGGPGGVIEVVTMPASGPGRVQARAQASTAPGALASATGRAEIAPGTSVRVSGGGSAGGRDYQVVMPDRTQLQLGEDASSAQAAMRVEHRRAGGTLVGDFWLERRSFLVPPGEDGGLQVMHVDGETSLNGAVGGTVGIGSFRLEGRGYAQKFDRALHRFTDATLDAEAGRETIAADREGVLVRANRLLGTTAELALTADFDTEHATDTDSSGATGGGRTALMEAGAGLRWNPRETVRLEAATGLFLPFDNPSNPWPEGKLSATWALTRALELRLTAARKGRMPTIRERYALMVGNPHLSPEMTSYGEAQVAFRYAWALVRSAAYVRRTSGLIRFNDARTLQVNYGDVTVEGVETTLELGRGRPVSGGASYQFAAGNDPVTGPGGGGMGVALENFPRHRADAWLQGRWGTRAGGWTRVRYIGDREDQGLMLGSYAAMELAMWLRVHRDLRVSLRVDNVTDAHYLERASQFAFGRTAMLSIDGVWE
jgi:outer membrane receptor protein involved in Fe transport